jgi:hypothetical protein
MKKRIFFALAITLIFFLFTACQPEAVESYTPIPAGTYSVNTYNFTAPDNLFGTPGGIAYAANVFNVDESGEYEPNPWPPVESVTTDIGSSLDKITVGYRAYIESQAGQTRNNIFLFYRALGFEGSELVLYSDAAPSGIGLTYSAGFDRPGHLIAVLMIAISPEVAPGEYMFDIGIEIDGKEYGTVPCTINVIK